MADIKLIVSESVQPIKLSVGTQNPNVNIQPQSVVEVNTSDYQKLNNKPSINGDELFDNYNEIDPTVPNWAKGEEPEEMNIADIYDIWQSVFN